MNHGLRIAGLLTVSLSLYACGEQPQSSDPAAQMESLDSLDAGGACAKLSSKAIDLSSLSIDGARMAKKGAKVSYSLSKAGSCIDGQDISWKAAASVRPDSQDKVFSPTFNQAGTYTVSAMVSTETSPEALLISQNTAVVGDSPMIVAPDVAMTNRFIDFEVLTPSGQQFASATWNFGDGTPEESSLQVIGHFYEVPGIYEISVTLKDSENIETNLSHRLNVVEAGDDIVCVNELAMSVPTEIVAGAATPLSVFIPQCLTTYIVAVNWNFGDGSASSGNQSVQHTYAQPGTYQLTVDLYNGSLSEPWVTLTREVTVKEGVPGDPDQVIDTDPTLLACKRPGATRQYMSELYSESTSCEMGGTKRTSYRDRLVQECQVGEDKILRWTDVSRTPEMQDEGVCEARSCTLPDGSTLAHGATVTLYATNLPEGTCSSVSTIRTCNDSQLSGSSEFAHKTCTEGCAGFGAHGSTKLAVITGSVSEPLSCQFGEEAFANVYQQLTDQTCQQGQILTSNTRKGELTSAGSCPTYQWQASESWTECSANCGGSQEQVFTCVNNLSQASDSSRCTSEMPKVSRICDGNPDAERREESSIEIQEGEASFSCPADQIGTITSRREVTTTKFYACLNHKVELADTLVTYGEWKEEQYCRDYVAHRCSGDSLSQSEAIGRLHWMEKCQDQVPVIKDYFEGIEGRKKSMKRPVYPTFLDRSKSPERIWKAPTKQNASCHVPDSVYVAAVCVSSCSTPEQQVLVGDRSNLKYVSFIDALTNNEAYVATLNRASTMNTTSVKSTKVDQWVTELVDSKHDILLFTMKSGRTLKVTTNHPLVSAEGFLKLADEFKVGESLVELGGALDEIVSIKAQNYFGKVYNVFVHSADPRQNIILINGYLNGTAYYQNEGAKFLNRQIYRSNLTRGVFE